MESLCDFYVSRESCSTCNKKSEIRARHGSTAASMSCDLALVIYP